MGISEIEKARRNGLQEAWTAANEVWKYYHCRGMLTAAAAAANVVNCIGKLMKLPEHLTNEKIVELFARYTNLTNNEAWFKELCDQAKETNRLRTAIENQLEGCVVGSTRWHILREILYPMTVECEDNYEDPSLCSYRRPSPRPPLVDDREVRQSQADRNSDRS